jgi:ribonuclease J
MVEIIAVGGYNEVGKNQTAINLGDDVIVCDAGFYLPAVIEVQESEQVTKEKLNYARMNSVGAIPDDSILDSYNLRDKVRSIIVSHAHLDHVGAVPYMASRYNATIAGTPFTMAILRKLMQDAEQSVPNQIHSVQPNGIYNVKGRKNYEVEFVNMTHSTPQTAMMVIHTPEGAIVYANDYKIDNTPVFGDKPNYDSIKRIAKSGVKALIIDSLYAGSERKTPSERIARDLLEEVMLTVNNERKGMVVSTFSSHIARLKSIVDFSKKLNREPIFIGRSMKKYVEASIEARCCPFKNKIRMGSYKKQVESYLKKASKHKDQYVVVCTGHQGEPGSILERISRKHLPYTLNKEDHIVFASKTIPVPINIANKEKMDKRLKSEKVRIFDGVHVSGHGGREDARDLIEMLSPEHVIPSHGELEKTVPMAELAKELGYKLGKTVHLMQNGQRLRI